jgi:hypothetical protein
LTRERKVKKVSTSSYNDDSDTDLLGYTVEYPFTCDQLREELEQAEALDGERRWKKAKSTTIIATIALLLGLAKPALVFWSMLTHSALGLFVLLSSLCIVVIVPLAKATAQRFFGDGELYVDDGMLKLYTWAKNHIFMLLVPAWVLFDLCYALVAMQAGYPEIVTILFLVVSAVPAIASFLVATVLPSEIAFGVFSEKVLPHLDIFAGMPSISDMTKGE